MRAQLSRIQGEYLALKGKYDKDFAGREGEVEELRWVSDGLERVFDGLKWVFNGLEWVSN